MATSQNGLKANDPSLNRNWIIPAKKGNITLPLRDGMNGFILAVCALWWDRHIEPLHPGWCWGYAARTIRGSSTELSNHASGSAADHNAPAHPLGTDPHKNFTAEALSELRSLVNKGKGAIRAGAFYNGRKDGMHLEIDGTVAERHAFYKKICGPGWATARAIKKANPGYSGGPRLGGLVPPKKVPKHAAGSDADATISINFKTIDRQQHTKFAKRKYTPAMNRLQHALNDHGAKLKTTGKFNPATKAAVKKFQKAQGWSGGDANGFVGPETLRRLCKSNHFTPKF